MNTRDMEVAVAKHFDFRRNMIVLRVAWGLGIHECDLLILSEAGYASEVEIKISKADLRRDAQKKHTHESDLIKAFYFAVPEKLRDCAIEEIPIGAGLLIVKEISSTDRHSYHKVYVERSPILRPGSRAFTREERYQLARLGLMRYWSWRGPIPETFAEAEA